MAAAPPSEECDKALRVAGLLAAVQLAQPAPAPGPAPMTFDASRAVNVTCGSRSSSFPNLTTFQPSFTVWLDVAYVLTLNDAQLDDAAFMATTGDVPRIGDPAELFEVYVGVDPVPDLSMAQLASAVRVVQAAFAAAAPSDYTAGVALTPAVAETLGAGRIAAGGITATELGSGIPAGGVPQMYANFASQRFFASVFDLRATTQMKVQEYGDAVGDLLDNSINTNVFTQRVDISGADLGQVIGTVSIAPVLKSLAPSTFAFTAAMNLFKTNAAVSTLVRVEGTATFLDVGAAVTFVTPNTRLGGPLV